jgi:aerobic carbon-monoxide dehydrogenase medium subunit
VKAPAVDYVRPRSLTQAVGLLSNASVEARVIAGGQSLMAMMNLRLATPKLLIDIARLPELISATDDGGAVTFGACVTHAAIEDDRVPDPSRGLMPRVAATLAYRAIRNRGTIGGSLALADPAAEWPAVLAALDAEVTLCGPGGHRSLKCLGFPTGIFETRLGADEIIEGVRVPKLSDGALWGYLKLCRKSGEFASALAVVIADPARDYSRVVIGAANGPPLALDDTARFTATAARDPAVLRSAIAADLDRAADRHFDDFQRNLHTVIAMRAVQQVLA